MSLEDLKSKILDFQQRARDFDKEVEEALAKSSIFCDVVPEGEVFDDLNSDESELLIDELQESLKSFSKKNTSQYLSKLRKLRLSDDSS